MIAADLGGGGVAAAQVFVADLEAPELDEGDRHHLGRVLRLRPGEAVRVSDGAGRWRVCRVGPGLALEPDGPVSTEARPVPAVTVGFALTKGERPEWVVQKLTEAGVDRILPVAAARSVVRWDGAKSAAQVARLRVVARGAAMQSRRVWLPEVDEVAGFDDAVGALGPGSVALAERGGAPPSLRHPAVLVGPEGGWAPEELDRGLPRVSLGPTVLRAETAAVAAGLLLCAIRAGLVGAVPASGAPSTR